jgi:hypothetical protein
MKTIVAGSRGIDRYDIVEQAIRLSGFTITELVSGTAQGVDSLGECWAKAQGIPVSRFPARWRTQGRAAGKIRNSKMSHYADALIAIWDGQSRGTKDMIDKAKYRGLKVYIYMVDLNDL